MQRLTLYTNVVGSVAGTDMYSSGTELTVRLNANDYLLISGTNGLSSNAPIIFIEKTA